VNGSEESSRFNYQKTLQERKGGDLDVDLPTRGKLVY
jgi:hypothetical protein